MRARDMRVDGRGAPRDADRGPLARELAPLAVNGRTTRVSVTVTTGPDGRRRETPTFSNEFWTSRQRVAHSLHEISYRACFKPQLPRFFIERLTRPGELVYDPFMGRGTTLIEASLMGRRVAGCDVNPLSRVLVLPRLQPPTAAEVDRRLRAVPLAGGGAGPDDLLVFFHPDTLAAICALREYLNERARGGRLDRIDRWIRMVAVNRLTGHSPGFFSVYTLPPNQAVSAEGQAKINAKRAQTPPYRDVRAAILKKTRSLLADCSAGAEPGSPGTDPLLMTAPAASTPALPDASVALVVTSPPFLDVVDYAGDNWLRCWFCGIDPRSVSITVARRVDEWCAAMADVFRELFRVVRPGGYVAFEVGEVRRGRIRLEEFVVPAAAGAGFDAELVLINAQAFTKTANCWGVTNNEKGTNSNRIVLLRRPR